MRVLELVLNIRISDSVITSKNATKLNQIVTDLIEGITEDKE